VYILARLKNETDSRFNSDNDGYAVYDPRDNRQENVPAYDVAMFQVVMIYSFSKSCMGERSQIWGWG
jgi:hypothetical protein